MSTITPIVQPLPGERVAALSPGDAAATSAASEEQFAEDPEDEGGTLLQEALAYALG